MVDDTWTCPGGQREVQDGAPRHMLSLPQLPGSSCRSGDTRNGFIPGPSREPTRTRRRLASTKNSDGASRAAVTAYSSPRTPFRTTKGSHRHHAGGRSSTRTRAPDVSETGTHLIGTQHPYSWCNAGYMTWLARAMSTHRLLQTVNHSALPGAAASGQLRTNHSAPVR